MLSIDEIFDRGVYFLLKASEGAFNHLTICLAEGFVELGIPISANINYWQVNRSPAQYLLTQNQELRDQAALCVVDISGLEVEMVRELLQSSLAIDAPKYILNNSDFELLLPQTADLNLVFRTHMNGRFSYPSHYVPWAFGISNRI